MNLNQFSTRLDVSAASMSELVAFYNASAGKSIKKFETRAKGVERCLVLLKPEGAPAPEGINPETAPKAEVTKVAKAEATPRKEARKPSRGTVTRPEASAMGAIAKAVVKADKKKPAPAKKAAKKASTPVSRGRALFSEDGVITLVHKGENPKRGTAAERFALYRSGMTVKAYIAAGGQRRDVVWDQHQGWVAVKG